MRVCLNLRRVRVIHSLLCTAREDARYFLRTHPRDAGIEPREDTDIYLRVRTCRKEVIAAALHAYFEEYLAETERPLLTANDDQSGFYNHLIKGARWDWNELKRAASSPFIGDDDSTGIGYEFVDDGRHTFGY